MRTLWITDEKWKNKRPRQQQQLQSKRSFKKQTDKQTHTHTNTSREREAQKAYLRWDRNCVEDGWPTSCLFALRNGSCKTIDNRRKQSSKQRLMGSDEERREAKRGREGEVGWVGGDWFTRTGRKCNIHTSRLPDSVQNAMFGQSGKTKIILNNFKT